MKIYEVWVTDIWNNNWFCGFYNNLDDCVEDVNNHIMNEKYHLEKGDIKEYSSTLDVCFDASVGDIVSSRIDLTDEDYDECDDDLSLMIRGFVFDSDYLKDEIDKLLKKCKQTNREWLSTLTDDEFVSWLLDGEEIKDYTTFEPLQPTPKLETLIREANSSRGNVTEWLKKEHK